MAAPDKKLDPDTEATMLLDDVETAGIGADDMVPSVEFLRDWIAADRAKTRIAAMREIERALLAEYGVTNRAAGYVRRMADTAENI